MRAPLVALAISVAGCRGAPDAALLALDVAGCQPVQFGAMVGFTLPADAPALDAGRRYRCLVFPGTADQQVQLTVFAQGFTPTVYLLDPGAEPHRLLAWSATGPGTGVARTTALLPGTAPYMAVVTTNGGETGTFLVSVQEQ